MTEMEQPVLDWARLAAAKAHLADGYPQLLQWFREDTTRSLDAIEAAMRERRAIAMLGPADLLKRDALHMGALSLAERAEEVEMAARDCVEWHRAPDSLLYSIAALRLHCNHTLEMIRRDG